jgi:uncharacterized protein
MRSRSLLLSFLVLPFFALAGPLEDGLKAYQGGQYKKAIDLLKPLAEQNNPRAQLRLGMMYYHGQGVTEDEKTALQWLTKAAEQGQRDAMFEIGNLYLVGHDAPKFNPEPDQQAAIWYNKAAMAGHAQAQYQLGLLFLAGHGVIRSDEHAYDWFRRSAAQGNLDAKRALDVVRKTK